MRSNKVSGIDLFTHKANENFQKHIKTQSKRALEILDKAINWEALIKPIESELLKERSDYRAGRSRFDLLVIVKCFILQHIYGLSDPRLEEEIADRRSFQLFLGLSSGDSIPDETTICRYREQFSRLHLDKLLFNIFKKQLQRKNLILEKVVLIDATLKPAQATAQSERDQDSSFTSRGGKSIYGYKGHIAMDLGSGMISNTDFTPANVHDSEKFESLLSGNESSVYADKGYSKASRTAELEGRGVSCGIMEKGHRNRPLTKNQKAINRQLSRIRSNVERPFAFMKRVLGYERCRYYDLGRNRFQFNICAIIYNMRRLLTYSLGIS